MEANKELLSLTMFFPCYNEEANVERVTRQAVEVCQSLTTDYEVIIVNDGSKDRTGEIADRLVRELPNVRAVHNCPNLGYGGALQSGYRAATKQWVFYTDGDGQFDMHEIAKLLMLRGENIIVSAYRMDRKDPLIRKINAWCWCTLVNVMFGMRVRDVDCAFKLFPARLFKQIEMRSMGALIDTEVLAKAVRLGYSIRQVGVHHYPRLAGQQTGANFKVILRAFRELFKLRRHILETVPKTERSLSGGFGS